MKHAFLLSILLLIFGCASKPQSAYRAGEPGHIKGGATAVLKLGMTRDDIVALYGPPQSVGADAGKETLFYVEELPWWNWKRIRITLVDGKVTQYGQD